VAARAREDELCAAPAHAGAGASSTPDRQGCPAVSLGVEEEVEVEDKGDATSDFDKGEEKKKRKKSYEESKFA
jgi:hypothetical protein